MIRRREALPHATLAAALAAVTTWLALLAWRVFLPTGSAFVVPAALLATLVALVGAAARWQRLPVPLVVVAQGTLAGLFLLEIVTDSAAPSLANLARLADALRASLDTARTYASPVPAEAPDLTPLLLLGALLCLVAVDLAGCALRRVPLAGLVVLAAYSVPVAVVGRGVTWWVFAAATTAFLALLFVQHDETVGRWGRPMGADEEAADPAGFGVRTGAVRASAAGLGGVAIALAVVVPWFVPTLDLDLLHGPGAGGDGEIEVADPTIDLRRDLQRGQDVPMVRVTTTDPRPDYLRIAVLTNFVDGYWSPGDREIPSEQRPDGPVPGLVGVAPDVPRREFDYAIRTTEDFGWTWLPTMPPTTRVRADGAWRYDTSTMDVVAAEDGLTAAGTSYDLTGVELTLDPEAMDASLSGAGSVATTFTRLPGSLPTQVRTLAGRVTDGATTRFRKAVALQRWFRETYTYDAGQVDSAGRSYADLLAFLDEDGDRRGYCEQFAASMAVMARTLDIPARVAVGFLQPQRTGPRSWEYSAHDLHAWPELYFPGSGWVRFEPTPGARADEVPGYTRIGAERPDRPDGPPSPGASDGALPERTPETPSEPVAEERPEGGGALAWHRVLVGAALLVLLALVVLVPRTVRRLQRDRRLGHGCAESAWQEVQALVLDLGLAWPTGRSPRSVGAWLGRHLGAPGTDPERPRSGRGEAPAAAAALDRLVLAVERDRYSARREPLPADTVRDDVQAVGEALRHGSSPRARRIARWWPRSVLGTATGTPGPAGAAAGGAARRTASSGLVDHVE